MKVIAVLPARNVEKTLELTVADIPKDIVSEIILVDNASKDATVEIAKKLNLTVIQHEKDMGYGGSQKTLYRRALDNGADIVVMIHPDYQYDPKLTPHLVAFIQQGICDIMLGNRIRTRKEALAGGMPLYKYVSNRFLTFIQNLIMDENLGEWHSGLRAFSRKVLETIPWENNSNDYVFDQEILAQAAAFGFRTGDIPVPAKYFSDASSISFSRSVVYGFGTLRVLTEYILHKTGIKKSPLFQRKKS
ncbi:MAG: glycosyltransferase family 2 protein [Elusimicrobiota bacterium]